MKKEHIGKDISITVVILSLAIMCSIIFQRLNVLEHITTVFVFAVFLISLLTDGYWYGMLSSIISVLAVNYAFTFPFLKWDFLTTVNLVSAAIMVNIAFFTCMLTAKLKAHEAIKIESEKERMRANLLRAISHDLRTPLTSIYGASCTLQDNKNILTEEQKDSMLKSIREDSLWLIRMVENLLSITKINNGGIKIIKTPIVLDELIDSVMTKFSSNHPGQKVVIDIPDDIVVVPMDAILIEQVLLNIMENAVYHATGMKQIILRVTAIDKKAVFEIEDDGCGIKRERLANIFTGCGEAMDDVRSDGRKKNAGIGLSVCATIIKAHDGTITAENKDEGGAIFRFTLDREDVEND